MKHLLTALLAGLLLTVSQASLANPHHQRLQMMKEKLELSDAQAQSIGHLINERAEQAHALKQKLKTIKRTIRQQMEADTVDESAIRTLTAQAAEHRANLLLLHARSKNDVKTHLTAEQLEKMQAMQEDFPPPPREFSEEHHH